MHGYKAQLIIGERLLGMRAGKLYQVQYVFGALVIVKGDADVLIDVTESSYAAKLSGGNYTAGAKTYVSPPAV